MVVGAGVGGLVVVGARVVGTGVGARVVGAGVVVAGGAVVAEQSGCGTSHVKVPLHEVPVAGTLSP